MNVVLVIDWYNHSVLHISVNDCKEVASAVFDEQVEEHGAHRSISDVVDNTGTYRTREGGTKSVVLASLLLSPV